MKTTHKITTLLAAGAVALSLTACGTSDTPSSADAATGAVTGDITFQTWSLKANFQEYFETLIKDFEAKNPGTKVNWIDQPADGYADKLSADAAGGTLPDVINLDPGSAYPLAQAGMLMNLTEADPNAAKDFLPDAWDAMTWKSLGGAFGYPWYLNTGPALFNKASFTQAGLDPAKLPTTYDELFDQANTMTTATNHQVAMMGQLPVIEDFGMYGVELMNSDQTQYTFNNAKGVEFVNKYKELYANGGLPPEALSQTYTGTDAAFKAGKTAYMPGSAFNVKQIREEAPTLYSTLAVEPLITNAKPNMYIQNVAVAAGTKNPATAIAFAKFVTNADNQLAFSKVVNIFPSTAGTLNDPYFTQSDGTEDGDLRVMCAEQIGKAAVYSPPTFTEAMKVELREQVGQAITGDKSIQDALDAAAAYANQRLSK